MKLITRDTDYAIKAFAYLSENKGRIISITELVEKLKEPKPFLRKILQTLANNKILNSYKGKNGGFELAVRPENLTLLDIIEVFQGKFKINDCLFKKDICPNKSKCLLKSRIDSIEKQVEEELKNTKLSSIL